MPHRMGVSASSYLFIIYPFDLIPNSSTCKILRLYLSLMVQHVQKARPLLEEYAIDELVDPRLMDNYSEQEVFCMLQAASLCISRDPQLRPRMSQVKVAAGL